MTEDFRRLIEKNANKIKRLARNYSFGNENNDLEQEIFLQIWRSYSSFSGQSNIDTWLYRIAINTAVSFQRKEIRDRKGVANSEQVQTSLNASDGLPADEILSIFMRELSAIEVAILTMYVDGLSSLQMEEVLGVKANAIKVRISRLKDKYTQRFIE